jgi:hypothetical protein
LETVCETKAPQVPGDIGQARTEDIIGLLKDLGIHLDRDSLSEAASKAGSPSALAQQWLELLQATSGNKNIPKTEGDGTAGPRTSRSLKLPMAALLTTVAFELWRRWLPSVHCAETLAEEFDRHYEPLDTLMFGNPLALREAVDRAHRIADACTPPGRAADQDLFEEIWSHTYHDLALWLRCLPQILAHRDLFDEAILLCERFAPIFDARAFMAERALLLARTGRHEEARRQVAANVRRWRRDATILKKSCETLWALGHADQALFLYDEVLELLNPNDQPRR